MKIIYYLLTLITLQSCLIGASKNSQIQANQNNHFPFLTGIDLNGKEYNLPNDFAGKLNIIALGFERNHQNQINTWIPSIDQLIKNSNPQIELKFYEVPLIYELGALKRSWVNNGMRLGIRDEKSRQQTITVYTNRDKFFEIMKMSKDTIYILLIDKKGKIILREEGEMTKNKIDNLVKTISNFSQ